MGYSFQLRDTTHLDDDQVIAGSSQSSNNRAPRSLEIQAQAAEPRHSPSAGVAPGGLRSHGAGWAALPESELTPLGEWSARSPYGYFHYPEGTDSDAPPGRLRGVRA